MGLYKKKQTRKDVTKMQNEQDEKCDLGMHKKCSVNNISNMNINIKK